MSSALVRKEILTIQCPTFVAQLAMLFRARGHFIVNLAGPKVCGTSGRVALSGMALGDMEQRAYGLCDTH